MIVEAIRSDAYGGSRELVYRKRSRCHCESCGLTYELFVHANEGEWEELADPLPPHFDLLQERINADHAKDNHAVLTYQTDGHGIVNPMHPKRSELAWSN